MRIENEESESKLKVVADEEIVMEGNSERETSTEFVNLF